MTREYIKRERDEASASVASTSGAKASGCSSLGLAQGRCSLLDFFSLSGGLCALFVQRLGLIQIFRFSSYVNMCVRCLCIRCAL
jgi:hypothetical protein